MIERYLLRYFLAVVDQGNFSRAAQQCGVSQPTLSVGIAKLETIVGQTLLHRSSRRVELTAAGAQFRDHARRIEAEFAAVEHALAQATPRRLVRMGIVTTLPSPWLEPALREAAAIPGEQLEIVEGRMRELMVALDSGRLDVVLGPIAGDRRAAEPLFTESYALALAPSHRLAHRDRVEPEEVAGEVMIVRRHCEALSDTSRFFIQRGVRPFFAARTTSDDRALAFVRSGLGITVMPRCYAGAGIAMPELAGFDAVRRIGLILDPAARRRTEESRALQAFTRSLLASHEAAPA